MTPKTIKKQDNFSCKHENTLKSMEFSEGDEYLCLLTDGCFTILVWHDPVSNPSQAAPVAERLRALFLNHSIISPL